MGEIDRQRIAPVKTLEALGYAYRDGEGWRPPHGAAQWREPDAMYELLVERAAQLARHHVFRDQTELRMISRALETYEARRWPGGRKVAHDPGP
jgi:hypothetical protein